MIVVGSENVARRAIRMVPAGLSSQSSGQAKPGLECRTDVDGETDRKDRHWYRLFGGGTDGMSG